MFGQLALPNLKLQAVMHICLREQPCEDSALQCLLKKTGKDITLDRASKQP